LLRAIDASSAELQAVVHATTLMTNALIERKGAITALVTTAGFADLLQIGREVRYDLYDLFLRLPEPLVPVESRFEVRERVLHDGTVLLPLDIAGLREIAKRLLAQGVEAVAICFLHAYANDAHEQAAGEVLRELLPETSISLSSDICREIREFERLSTTVANAFVQPLAGRYLSALADSLRALGSTAPLLIMLSNGGIASAPTAARQPVRLVESGPAAGALIAGYHGRRAGKRRVLAFDMGGTTAKLCLVEDGQPTLGYRLEVARVHRFKRGSGLPLQTPSVELIEIGAGGGSIARRDELGLLAVGPQSAGAEPGPACYGFGGQDATVTDADLLLGYLNADYFLGGGMPLQRAAAEETVARLAKELGLTPEQTAWGMHELVNENMATAAGVYIAERGQDPRSFTLIATGGAGPVHAAGVARKIGIATVLVPPAAGVASAGGLLVAPPRSDQAHTLLARLDAVDWPSVNRLLHELEHAGRAELAEVGAQDGLTITRSVDMRYLQQGHELNVPLPAGPLSEVSTSTIAVAFEEHYGAVFGRIIPGVPVELVTWRVAVQAADAESRLGEVHSTSDTLRPEATRLAYFPSTNWTLTQVFDRAALAPGDCFEGPLIVEEAASTTILGPRDSLTVDGYGNLILTIASGV
jgi:N-methylhydantoinase A/oxoprolinase/acetone carboxylase beta subunit